MPGLPNLSLQTLSAEQIDRYKLTQSADLAARYLYLPGLAEPVRLALF